MTDFDRTEPSQHETLWFEFELAHPPEKVWRALTDPELLASWLLPVTGLRLEPGHDFTFRTEPVGDWDGIVHCRVLVSDPPKKLRYAWVVGELDMVVTFTLRPVGAGTRLSLVHSGFEPGQKRNFGGARYGWRTMSQRLIDLLGASS